MLVGFLRSFINCLLLLFPFSSMAFFGVCLVFKGQFFFYKKIIIPYLFMECPLPDELRHEVAQGMCSTV